jgi:hypothetical protein
MCVTVERDEPQKLQFVDVESDTVESVVESASIVSFALSGQAGRGRRECAPCRGVIAAINTQYPPTTFGSAPPVFG